jgi:hypothetical protein
MFFYRIKTYKGKKKVVLVSKKHKKLIFPIRQQDLKEDYKMSRCRAFYPAKGGRGPNVKFDLFAGGVVGHKIRSLVERK